MTEMIVKVLKFLWVTVWGNIRIYDYLKRNKNHLILVGSNIALSLLFIYMTEQATVRTNQYRELQRHIEEQEDDIKTLEDDNELLEARLVTLRQAFALTDTRVDTESIINEYDAWASELDALKKEIEDAQERRLGEIYGKPKQHTRE